jgi:hypothetical protein
MATYVPADLPEVATALAALTGEDHPLAISAQPRAVPISGCLPSPPDPSTRSVREEADGERTRPRAVAAVDFTLRGPWRGNALGLPGKV